MTVASFDEQTAELTPREREVVRHLLKGDSTKAIASGMGITVSTVRVFLRFIYQKLCVRSRAELMARLLGGKT
jgi:DNA-binding NarL/FixJ family response regulator